MELIMKQLLQNSILILMLAILVACAQLGLATPETFNEKLAAGYVTVTEMVTTTTALLKAGKIKSDDAANIQVQVNTAKAGLDIAKQVAANDPKAADAKLVAVRTVLTALSTYLATKQ